MKNRAVQANRAATKVWVELGLPSALRGGTSTIFRSYHRTFLFNMGNEDLNPAFWKMFAACLASMLITIAVIVEFFAAIEEVNDNLILFPTHSSTEDTRLQLHELP